MSNFCLQQTAFHPSGNAVLPISSLVKNWLVRRAVSRLDRLNDRLLRDVGITRNDVRWAASLPLSQNAARALMTCADHRGTPEGMRCLIRVPVASQYPGSHLE